MPLNFGGQKRSGVFGYGMAVSERSRFLCDNRSLPQDLGGGSQRHYKQFAKVEVIGERNTEVKHCIQRLFMGIHRGCAGNDDLAFPLPNTLRNCVLCLSACSFSSASISAACQNIILSSVTKLASLAYFKAQGSRHSPPSSVGRAQGP